MAKLRSQVARKQQEITAKQKELERLMQDRLAAACAALGPLEKKAKLLQEGIYTIGLYLGHDEGFLTLRGGEPAGAEEPIVVRQLVLSMDEECAVAAEAGGIDAQDLEKFDRWLLEDEAHVEQVIPEKKAVVALVPRFTDKSYEDPWESVAVAGENRQTYFLIRNGERLYWTWTDFRAGKRLVPARDEFTSFFQTKRTDWKTGEDRTVRLEPGTLRWTQAEEAADARRRHYMRVAMVLQGLVDRTTVFHPLPDDELGVGFLEEKHYFADRVRIVMDAEPALTEAGHEPFRKWQKRLNAGLRPGMRLIGAFNGMDWIYANEYEKTPGHSRLQPPRASDPQSHELHTIEERIAGEVDTLVFRYERDDDIWDPDAWRDNPDRPGWGWRGQWRKPKTRAACTIRAYDTFVLPFDLVSVEEMERYLRSRTDRGDYLSMFPLLKAAIRAKRREDAEEEPFRAMLAGVLARENSVEVSEAVEEVGDLVDWWKFTNRNHRPLVGGGEAGEEENARAVQAIVAEHARRLRDRRRTENTPDDPEILARLRKENPGALVIARKRDAKWVVLTPERDESESESNVFVRQRLYMAKGELREERPWHLVNARSVSSWRILHASERWEGWNTAASLSEYLSGPEQETLAEELMEKCGRDKMLAISYLPDRRHIAAWTLTSGAQVDEERPLTSGLLRGPGVDFLEYEWERGHDRSPRLGYRRRSGGRPVRKDGRYPGVVLYESEEIAGRLESENARYEEARELYNKLRSEALRYGKSIEEAWLARAEKEAYERFVEDYGDLDLWEGHRKTLKISYPHRGSGLGRLVELLVEEGVDLDGLTVSEAQELARQNGIEIGSEEHRRFGDHRGYEIPEDVLDLVLVEENDDEGGNS